MANLLNTELVQYQCSCGTHHPLNEMYFCRPCFTTKCIVCASQQIDNLFCRACFENVAFADSRAHKNKCATCYECPICGMVLTSRAVNDKYRLQCNNCKFTSLDAGSEDRETQNSDWTMPPDSAHEEHFTNVKNMMKKLSAFEKSEHERLNEKRRRSNMVHVSDRYGLHMYTKKKLEAIKQPPLLGTDAVQVDDEKETTLEVLRKPIDPNSIPTYEQQLRCVNTIGLHPLRIPLTSRRTLRCNISDNGLVKSEYNPVTSQFRIRALALAYVPEIRIVKPVRLFPTIDWPLFIYVSNNSSASMEVKLKPLEVDDKTHVQCSTEPMEFTLPNANSVADLNQSLPAFARSPSNVSTAASSTSNIVLQKRHRVGVHFQVKPKAVQEMNYLLLELRYEFSGNPFPSATEHIVVTPQMMKIRIELGPSENQVTEEELHNMKEQVHPNLSKINYALKYGLRTVNPLL